MVDAIFGHPRLAGVYDRLDSPRPDLDAYCALAAEFGAGQVLDIGCGTGVLALRLASEGRAVSGLDPALASLAVARTKPGADRVAWVHGGIGTTVPGPFDLAVMTGNVAQAIVDPGEWRNGLRVVHEALRPGGHLVFETRIPARRAWEGWGPQASRRVVDVPGEGVVEHWTEVTSVRGPLVSFRGSWRFHADGALLTSDSTLRFRERAEVEDDLRAAGYELTDVRDAPDRPGREWVFVARRPAGR